MLINVSTHTMEYLEKSTVWVNVSMTKALKLWSNSHVNIKCEIENELYLFFNGYDRDFKINSDMINKAKWYIEQK